MLAGKIHYLIDLGFSDIIGENAAYADSATMHMEHYLRCAFPAHTEKAFQYVNNEFHWCVIIV